MTGTYWPFEGAAMIGGASPGGSWCGTPEASRTRALATQPEAHGP